MDGRLGMTSAEPSEIEGGCRRSEQRCQDSRIVGAGLAEVGFDQGRTERSGDRGLPGSSIVPVDEDEADVCIAIDGIELAVLDLDDDDGL